MNCPQCNQELVHRGSLWMCVECSYAETEQLHDQRLRIGTPERPDLIDDLPEAEEEVGRAAQGQVGGIAQRQVPQTADPADIFRTGRPLINRPEHQAWWTTTVIPTPNEAIPIQEAPNGGVVEFHPTTFAGEREGP